MFSSLFGLQESFSEIQEGYLQKGIDKIERLIKGYGSLQEAFQTSLKEDRFSATGYYGIENPPGNAAS